MKVIADMGEDSFLVEATGTEIANIIGVVAANRAPMEATKDHVVVNGILRGSTRIFKVGAEFNISPAYQWLAKFKQSRADTLEATSTMRAFLDHVEGLFAETMPPIILTPDDVDAEGKGE